MKKVSKVFAAGVLLAASCAPLVAVAAVNVDVNIGLPGFTTYVTPQPTYYYPPAYYAPAYYPPAAYYAPAPRPVYRHDHWDQRWERRWDRRGDREYRHDDRRRW